MARQPGPTGCLALLVLRNSLPARPIRDRYGNESESVLALALVGFLGGLITGISPCILPVLPVIFFSGVQGAATATAAKSEGAVSVKPKRELSEILRPYRVIGGL